MDQLINTKTQLINLEVIKVEGELQSVQGNWIVSEKFLDNFSKSVLKIYFEQATNPWFSYLVFLSFFLKYIFYVERVVSQDKKCICIRKCDIRDFILPDLITKSGTEV